MDISSIGGMGGVMNQPRPERVTLTDEQKSTMQEIVGKYDPANFSREEAESLREELKSAGIGPSQDTAEFMKELGFERPPGPPPGGGKPGPQIDSEIKNQLMELISSFKDGDMEEDELISAFEEILKESDSFSGNFLDDSI